MGMGIMMGTAGAVTKEETSWAPDYMEKVDEYMGQP